MVPAFNPYMVFIYEAWRFDQLLVHNKLQVLKKEFKTT